MFHFIKRFWLVLALTLAGAQTMFGFAMLGPINEAFQVSAIGYGLSGAATGFEDNGGLADLGAPKNFGQGYRWNTPTNYYAYDESFDRYFGATGESNIDMAFTMFNNLTNLAAQDLNVWPLYATRINHTAKALQLVDLKSTMMSLLIEQIGLAQPDRWTWCLHDRYTDAATCPNYAYSVIQRNFDPFTQLYSSYVNDVLYDFRVEELCALNPNPFAPLLADAVEVLPDPTQEADAIDSVAAYGTSRAFGAFFLSFTRDDVGGLKSLYSPTNAYAELAESNSVQIVTNIAQPVLLVTSNLAIFESQALTNDDATLAGLYPGLVIVPGLTTNFWTNVVTTNISAYVTNPPFAPAGTVQLVLTTNYVTNVVTLFVHTFANLEIVHTYPKSFISKQVVDIQPVPFAPAGTVKVVTNITRSVVNVPNGDFYILPTNLCGPYTILSTQFVQVVATTNLVPIATNLNTFFTNSTSTNFQSLSFITYATNYFLVAAPVDCITNTEAVRGGMNGFHFVRQEFDPILNQLVTPVTNIYQLTAISNGVPVIQTFKRVLTQPDILISAGDLATGPAAPPGAGETSRTTPRFVQTLVPPTAAGPGTIEPTGIQFVFDDVGPIYFDALSFFLLSNGSYGFSQATASFIFQWGSFDGTTNAPIVYPDTNSIAQMEAQLFYQITTALLPTASVSANGPGNAYTYTLQASANLVPSLTWTLVSGQLPPGLTLTPDGTISGSPTAVGTYDFTVQVMDSRGKVTQKSLFIVVNP